MGVHERESADLAAALIADQCAALGLDPRGLVLHADNGGPMKGATMVATLERLGILPSFSRPSVSDDNPYSEALFRRFDRPIYRLPRRRRPLQLPISAASTAVIEFRPATMSLRGGTSCLTT